jgi:hypothetical protein
LRLILLSFFRDLSEFSEDFQDCPRDVYDLVAKLTICETNHSSMNLMFVRQSPSVWI